MLRINEVKVNKLLTIIIIILTVFILCCAYYLKGIREKEQKELNDLKEKQELKDNNVAEVVYRKETFGLNFDFLNLDVASVLDEYKGYKFIRYEDMYYVIDDVNTYNCEYIFDEKKDDYNYRYCTVNDSIKIDFASLKFVRNND